MNVAPEKESKDAAIHALRKNSMAPTRDSEEWRERILLALQGIDVSLEAIASYFSKKIILVEKEESR